MFKHLLVPLDGTPRAEAAVPAAAGIAQRAGATVSLLHVIEHHAPATIHGERHLRTPEEASAYLEGLRRCFSTTGVSIACHVHTVETTDVAGEIADHVFDLNPDLVIMIRHGRPALREAVLGSLPQQVVARGTVPVLLLRSAPARLSAPPPFVCRRVMIPHDVSPAHEPALPVGMEFARLWNAEARLVMIVPTLGTLAGFRGLAAQLLPGATEAVLDIEQAEAQAHVSRHVEQMRSEGAVVSMEVIRGDPPRAIVRAAKAFGADLLVLGTHGKAGTQAFWAGSTAARVCARFHAPVLLVPLR